MKYEKPVLAVWKMPVFPFSLAVKNVHLLHSANSRRAQSLLILRLELRECGGKRMAARVSETL